MFKLFLRGPSVALGVFAGIVIEDKEFIYRLMTEETMGLERSTLVQVLLENGEEKGLEKGRKEGLRLGLVEARRADLLAVLRSRFGKVETKLEAQILRIEDPKALAKLIGRAAVVPSLRQFARELTR